MQEDFILASEGHAWIIIIVMWGWRCQLDVWRLVHMVTIKELIDSKCC